MIQIVRLLALSITAAWALAGCEKVQFQSPPSWPIETCDSEFIGDWRVFDAQKEDSHEGDQMYLRIGEGCQSWLGVEVDGNDSTQVKVQDLQSGMSLGFAHSDGFRFLVSREHADPSTETDQDAPPEGYVLARYQSVGEVLELQLLDPVKTAHLIVDGALPGWLEKRDRAADGAVDVYAKRFSIYVFGTPNETALSLDRHAGALLQPVWLRLHRLDPSMSATMDAWVADGPTKKAIE